MASEMWDAFLFSLITMPRVAMRYGQGNVLTLLAAASQKDGSH